MRRDEAEKNASRRPPHWFVDLGYVFRGVKGCTPTIPIGEQCPIIWIMDFQNIALVFGRFGLEKVIRAHVEKLRKMPPLGAEMRMMQDFTYGFTHLVSKRKYQIHSFIWYFKNDETPLDAAGVMGIAPAGTEGLVAAKIKELRENSEVYQTHDATMCEFLRRPTEPNN